MIDAHIRELLRKDVEERTLMRQAMKRVKGRQLAMIVIGVAIFLMFSLNYISLQRQAKRQEVVVSAVAAALVQGAEIMADDARLIKTQDSVIKNLQTNEFPKK